MNVIYDNPSVSVILATRNRGASVTRPVQSILANRYSQFELIVVDQSDSGATQTALRPFLNDSRLTYIRTTTSGLQVARNLGAHKARNEIIVTTDDDCETPTDWLQQFVSAFAVDRRIAVVVGSVLAGPYDPAKGFIPSYSVNKPLVARCVHQRHLVEGMGACFGFRKSVWSSLNGFDPLLGTGAPFQSAGETDFAMSALLSGYFVYQTPNVKVFHHGFRNWEQGAALVYRYLYGVGAVYVKNLRHGNWSVLGDLYSIGRRFLTGGRAVHLGNRSYALLKLKAFLAGMASGLNAPLDTKTGHFQVPGAPLQRNGSSADESTCRQSSGI